MANNLSLGIIVGARTDSSVGRVFHSLDAQAKQLGRSLRQMRIGGAGGDEIGRVSAQLERVNKLRADQSRRRALGGEMLGTAGMALGAAFALAGPMKQALSFEHELRLFGNVVNFNNAQLAETKKQLQSIASATNQYPGELLSALNTLASKGLDPARALASLNIIGKTATAAGADVNELATTSFTLIDAMGLKPTELPKAMDMLAQAGKLGSFELKDMATYFPQLTAQAKSLGLSGTQGIATMGAALQVAMKGASDPAQAANNFQNFLTKLTSQETVKRFKKMGVDVQKVMSEATQKGADPVIAMVEKIQEITGGNKFKMSELFSDMQVLGFLNPMIANLDEFNRIKKASLEANNVINTDYAAMMATGTEQLKNAGIEAQKLGEIIGSALGPALNSIVATIKPVVQSFGEWAANNKPIIMDVISLVGGLIGLKLAMLGGAYALSLLSSGWTIATGVAAFFSNGLLATRIGLLALSVQTKLAAAGQWLMNAAFLGCPIVWIIGGITALGALAFVLVKNWEPISAWFKKSWDAIGEAAHNLLGSVTNAFASMATAVRSVWEPVMAWFIEKFTWIGKIVEKVRAYAGEVGKFMTTPLFGGSAAKTTAPGILATAGNSKLPALAGAGPRQMVTNTTHATIHVTQLPGQNSEQFADHLIKKWRQQENKDRRGALHD